jgi:hypothetical protein
VTYALLTVCAALFAWKTIDLIRDVRNPAAWSVAAACGSMAAVVVFAKPVVVAWTDQLLGTDSAALIRNLALVGCFAALQLFYLSHIAVFRARRRIQIELVVVASAVSTMTVAALAVPQHARLVARSDQLDHPSVLVFFFVATGYLVYACLTQVFWTLRFHHQLQQVTLRISTTLIGTGCLLLMIPQARKLALYVEIALTGTNPVPVGPWLPALLLVRLGIPLLLLGLLLPIIVADGRMLAAIVRSAIYYHRLGPLDRLITAAFPELVRPAQPGGRTMGTSTLRHNPTRIGFAYHERLQRCRDGYVRALPLIAGDVDTDRRELQQLAATLDLTDQIPAEHLVGDQEHLLAVSDALRYRSDRAA